MEAREADPAAAALGARTRPGEALAPGECETAVETGRGIDAQLFPGVPEGPAQVLEVRCHIVFWNADKPRQVAGGDGTADKSPTHALAHGQVSFHQSPLFPTPLPQQVPSLLDSSTRKDYLQG